MSKRKKLCNIFFSTLYLSAFTFGGGYVIITLMQKTFVEKYHWIDEKEMIDLIAIAQSAPGAIAVNGAIVIGYKLAGISGVCIAVIGTVLPPFVIISILSIFYHLFNSNSYVHAVLDGMQAGVAAVIASVVFEMGGQLVKERSSLLTLIMILSFVANYWFNINVIYIILTCILLGFLQAFFLRYKGGRL